MSCNTIAELYDLDGVTQFGRGELAHHVRVCPVFDRVSYSYEYIIITMSRTHMPVYNLISEMLLAQAGPAKALPERLIGCAPLNKSK